MDRLTQMSVFVAVAEEEGFAAASRRLNISPPVVTRAVAELEERLGVKLLTRTTRYVKITDAGKGFLEDARRIIEEITIAEEAASGINSEASGHLSVTAPSMFGRMFVLPSILQYLEKYPKTEVTTVFLDRVVNLLEEGLDVGIRIGALPDSSMRAIKVGTVRHVLCVAPAYIKKYGLPKTPKELTKHNIISASGVTPSVSWKFSKCDAIRLQPRLVMNSNDAVIEAVKSGFGISRLISYQIAPELASGKILSVLSDYEREPIPIHVIHRENRQGSAKVRSFVDLIAKNLKAEKALN